MGYLSRKKTALLEAGEYFGRAEVRESVTLKVPGAWVLHEVDGVVGSAGDDTVVLMASAAQAVTVNLGRGDDRLLLGSAAQPVLKLAGVETLQALEASPAGGVTIKGAAAFASDGSLDLSVVAGDRARQVVTFAALHGDAAIDLGRGKDAVVLGEGFVLVQDAAGRLLALNNGHALTFAGSAEGLKGLVVTVGGVAYRYADLLAGDLLNVAPVVGAVQLGVVDQDSLQGLQVAAVDLLGAAEDADGDALQVVELRLAEASSGVLHEHADGVWTFVPAAGFHGEVQLLYGVSDGVHAPVAASAALTVTALADSVAALMLEAQGRSLVLPGVDAGSFLDDAHIEVRALDAEFDGYAWEWPGQTITYGFNETLPADYFELDLPGWRPLPAEIREGVDGVMAALDGLIARDIVKVADGGDIRFNMIDSDGTFNAYAYYPASDYEYGGDVFLSNEINVDKGNGIADGEFGKLTVVHELGHALGLQHPFDELVKLPVAQDDVVNTVMSYTDYGNWLAQFSLDDSYALLAEYSGLYPGSFMVYDIAALQFIYGPELTAHVGDDVYAFGEVPFYTTIWDAGGVDTLDFSLTRHANRIDLRPGAYSDVDFRPKALQVAEVQAELREQMDGSAHYDGDVVDFYAADEGLLHTGARALGIAYGAVVENAIGGAADDVFYDNRVDNLLRGGAGDDVFHLGAGGFDTVYGDAGQDVLVVDVAHADVQLVQSSGALLLLADAFAVQLVGVETIQFAELSLAV